MVSQLSLANLRRCSSKKNDSLSHPGVCHHCLPCCSTGACVAIQWLREAHLTQLEKTITKKGIFSARSASCFSCLCWWSCTAPTQREGEKMWPGRDWNCTFQQQWRSATRDGKPLLHYGVSRILLHQFCLLRWGLFFSPFFIIGSAMLCDCTCSITEKRCMLRLSPWAAFAGSVSHTSTLWLLLQLRFQAQTPHLSTLVFTSTCI